MLNIICWPSLELKTTLKTKIMKRYKQDFVSFMYYSAFAAAMKAHEQFSLGPLTICYYFNLFIIFGIYKILMFLILMYTKNYLLVTVLFNSFKNKIMKILQLISI